MTQSINPDQYESNNDDNKDLLAGKDSLEITVNDDEDILKNDAARNAVLEKAFPLAEFQEDMEDEDDLNEEAETSGVL